MDAYGTVYGISNPTTVCSILQTPGFNCSSSIMMAQLDIHLVYTIFFLWIEPIGILMGGLQAIFDPIAHLQNFTPIFVPAIRPEYSVAIYQLGACEIFIAGIEAFILRIGRHDRRIWNAMLGCEMVGDLIHGYGLWITMGTSLFTPIAWRWQECVNIGLLVIALILRPGFLLGIGVREVRPKGQKALN